MFFLFVDGSERERERVGVGIDVRSIVHIPDLIYIHKWSSDVAQSRFGGSAPFGRQRWIRAVVAWRTVKGLKGLKKKRIGRNKNDETY